MSRSYAYKPEIKKSIRKTRADRKVILSDFDIEFIELSLGPEISLKI
jgi:hypothetical protein